MIKYTKAGNVKAGKDFADSRSNYFKLKKCFFEIPRTPSESPCLTVGPKSGECNIGLLDKLINKTDVQCW